MGTQVAQLAIKLAQARSIQQQMSEAEAARRSTDLQGSVQAAIARVSSERAVHDWQARCRTHFGAGNRASLAELAQMAASEARLQKQGHVAADLDHEIVGVFAEPL